MTPATPAITAIIMTIIHLLACLMSLHIKKNRTLSKSIAVAF